MIYNTARDDGYIAELHAPVQQLARAVLSMTRELVELHGLQCRAFLTKAYRSPKEQMEAFRKGRALVQGQWVKSRSRHVVTNARPNQTGHCCHKLEGKKKVPCAMAFHVGLLDLNADCYISGGEHDLRMSVVPLAIHLAGQGKIISGAFFRSIPGGDWWHAELAGWQELCVNGEVQ